MLLKMPLAGQGQRIGLFGGSFDPPHQGHVDLTLAALKAFHLDQVWWLVSPGNPLKKSGPAPFAQRLAASRAIMQHPQVHVTDLERQIGTRYTARTLAALKEQRSDLNFIWLMGADNLAQIHLWRNWQAIFEAVPVGVIARGGQSVRAQLSPAARRYDRINQRDLAEAGTWAFASMPLNPLSSTLLRAEGAWR